ncbi:MAG: DUF421 domain-containing protein [Thermotaleaceae bacterium]
MKEWIEMLIRILGLFFIAFIVIKLYGNSSLSRISSFRFIAYGIISVTIALLSLDMVRNISYALLNLTVWILLPVGFEYLSLQSKRVHDLLYGKEKILIQQGKIMEESLKKARLTGEELLSELRTKNAFFMADVEFAIMEPSGEINVLLKSEKSPISAKTLGKKTAPKAAAQTIILDGNIIHEGLKNLNLNEKWLKYQLENAGVALENIFIGQAEETGEVYLDTFDDKIQLPQPTVKEMLYANLEKVYADLLAYSLETKDENVKMMYKRNAEKMDDILKKLESYLLR